MNLKNLILASRPQTLTAILGPIIVAYFLALRMSPETFQAIYLIPILISGLAIQIATNLFNDYLDASRDGDKQDRLGPVRVTSSALVHAKTVKLWALSFCAIALLAGVPIVLKTGWIFVALGLFCILLSYLYTGTKWSLAYTGTADFFVIVFFGGFAVWGSYYTLTLRYDIFPFLLGLQLGCLCDILLMVNNLRDQHQDVANHKKTIVVRYGRGVGVLAYLLLISIGFFGTLFWPEEILDYRFFLLALPWLCFNLYFWNWVRKNKPSQTYNKILKFTSLTYFGFCVSICIGLLLFVDSTN